MGDKTASAAADLARFWQRAMRCHECPSLAPWRKFPPAARGNPDNGLMILGEAPGRVSLENGRPFSNPRNLTVRRAIALALLPTQLEIEDAFYFSDAVKCWPTSPSGANRSPSNAETVTCVNRYLARELEIVHPRVIFAFGVRAASAVLGRSIKIAEVHASTIASPAGYRVIPLMHPSSINIAGMRRVGIRSLEDYTAQLAELFRRELRGAHLIRRVGAARVASVIPRVTAAAPKRVVT
ncbi:MAG TPA: uracil-DNA glycosylase family protein [Candidatus Binataceae bacterium]|nr:uracil-DNA glycosylase family protein [Candidatus Binataceae bacterium]